MTLKQITNSLAFLLSLSVAAIASEKDELKSGESLSQRSLSYSNKNGETTIYTEEEYTNSLTQILNEHAPLYAEKYNEQFETKADKTFRANFYGAIISYCVGTISMMASGSISTFFSSGIISFSLIRGLGEFFIVRSPTPRISYNDAKSTLRDFAMNDLYDKGYLTEKMHFPLDRGYSLFDSSMKKITNPSTVTR